MDVKIPKISSTKFDNEEKKWNFVIHPNRYFIWAIVAILIAAILLTGYIWIVYAEYSFYSPTIVKNSGNNQICEIGVEYYKEGECRCPENTQRVYYEYNNGKTSVACVSD